MAINAVYGSYSRKKGRGNRFSESIGEKGQLDSIQMEYANEYALFGAVHWADGRK